MTFDSLTVYFHYECGGKKLTLVALEEVRELLEPLQQARIARQQPQQDNGGAGYLAVPGLPPSDGAAIGYVQKRGQPGL